MISFAGLRNATDILLLEFEEYITIYVCKKISVNFDRSWFEKYYNFNIL